VPPRPNHHDGALPWLEGVSQNFAGWFTWNNHCL
jgi:hypothetical protein